MWPIIPALAIITAQTQPIPSAKWCFERGQQGAQLCEETEAECIKLRSINTEIATSPCKPVEAPKIEQSPTEPAPAPPQKPDRDLPR